MRRLLLLLLAACSLPAQTYTTILNNGDPANRIDVVILGDGYTSAELGKFGTDAQQMAATLFSEDPWKEYKSYFNVHRVDVASQESGADHPESVPQVFKNTAFDAAYNCSGIQRLICVNTTKVNTTLSSLLTPAQRDIVLVVVNDSVYGGSGGSIAVVSTNQSSPEIALHELGHSFGLLTDEYGGPPPPACVSWVEPSAANATIQTVRAQIKWNAWIDALTPIPTLSTSAALPGLYQGAAYCDAGVYRPTYNSKMRNLGVPYEQINVEQLTRRIYNLVNSIDAASPSGTTITATPGQVLGFSAAILLPATHSLNAAWSVDGQTLGTGSAFQLSTASLAGGSHTVTLNVSDPTALVRSDPTHLLTDTRSWTVNVSSPCSFSLSPQSLSIPNVGATPTVTVTTQSGCAWTAVVNSVSWITITGGASGTGSGIVSLSVTGNGATVARNATLTIAGQTLTVTQAAGIPPCASSISTPSATATVLGGAGSVAVTAPVSCSWIAVSSAPWLTIGAPGGGAGSASFSYTVAANNSVSQRTATISISGFTFVLFQNGSQILDSTFFIQQLYLDLLNRQADPAGLSYWVNSLNNGSVTRKDAALSFFNSAEFQSTGLYVIGSYIAVLGRDPDFGGWLFWLQTLQNGAPQKTITQQFIVSPEFVSTYGSLTNTAFVNLVYQNVLGRAPDTGGLNFWVGQLNAGGSRTDMMYSFVVSPEFQARIKNRALAILMYMGFLRRSPEPTGLNFWANALNAGLPPNDLVDTFITSPEYILRF